MKNCIFTIGSVTYAMKAKRALNAENISAKVIKTDNLKSSNGCAYGIEFDCTAAMSVAAVLRTKGIEYRYLTTHDIL